MLYLFWVYFYGIIDDWFRLYFDDFVLVLIGFLFIELQSDFVNVLGMWDCVIVVVKLFVENFKKVKLVVVDVVFDCVRG